MVEAGIGFGSWELGIGEVEGKGDGTGSGWVGGLL